MFPHGRRDPEEFESTPRDPEEFESTPTEEEEHSAVYTFDDDFQHPSVSQRSDIEELSSASDSHGKKSPIELFTDAGEKVEVILGKIGVDINRALTAKRQRMETSAQQSFEGVEMKMKDVWNSHEDALAQLNEESAQAFTNLFEQWDEDFKKFREQHEKLVNDFKEQEKVFQQARFIQSQRLRTIQQVHEEFLKNLEDLEIRNDALLTGTQSELKEEINKLQRKIMRESVILVVVDIALNEAFRTTPKILFFS
ncbi:synaptonemal complex protein 3-like [Apodemus sylvaticus]|uniref:synaptonemal complex protein 3-like n=1 Tax=Apodemus sylvaticus TaxID=10129 RepID=UPI0022447F77|nr:synaptonemal complex protein 3-like [Apodemus sylvaticus]